MKSLCTPWPACAPAPWLHLHKSSSSEASSYLLGVLGLGVDGPCLLFPRPLFMVKSLSVALLEELNVFVLRHGSLSSSRAPHPLPPALSLVLLLQIPAPRYPRTAGLLQPAALSSSVPSFQQSIIPLEGNLLRKWKFPAELTVDRGNCSFVKYSSVVLEGKGSTKARTCPKAGRAPRRGRVGLPWLISRV